MFTKRSCNYLITAVLLLMIATLSNAWAVQKWIFDADHGEIRTINRAFSISLDSSNDWQFKGGDLVPSTTNAYDIGTTVKKWRAGQFAGTVTANAFSGPITGAVTGAVNGTVGATTPNTGVFTTVTANGNSVLAGGVAFGRQASATSVTALSVTTYVGITDTSAPRTVNLPAVASLTTGFTYIIKDEGGLAGTNNITVDANAAETIDGALTKLINTNYGALRIYNTGTAWMTF